MMHTVINQWGNSLGVRIPATLVKQLNISCHQAVEMHVDNGALIIQPKRKSKYSLDELIEGITTENVHPYTDTGHAVGNEVW
jgi:antitoxin MazE